MPTRTYYPQNEPPSFLDRMLLHPAEIMVAVFWIITGGVLALSQVLSGFSNSSILRLPVFVGFGITSSVTFGGILILIGTFWRGKVSTEWITERSGWMLGGVGWLAYAVTLVWLNPDAVVTFAQAMCMVTMALLRIRALYLIEKRVRASIKGKS